LRRCTRPRATSPFASGRHVIINEIDEQTFHRWGMTIMSSYFARAGFGLIAVLGLACLGCQEDNEAAIKPQAPTASGSEAKDTLPPPATRKEYAERNKGTSQKPQGYPGAKK